MIRKRARALRRIEDEQRKRRVQILGSVNRWSWFLRGIRLLPYGRRPADGAQLYVNLWTGKCGDADEAQGIRVDVRVGGQSFTMIDRKAERAKLKRGAAER